MFEDLSSWERGNFLYLLLLLILIMAGSTALRGQGLRRTLKMFAGWVLIFAVLLVVAAYREDAKQIFNRVAAEVDPTRAVEIDDELRIQSSIDGHFWIRAEVNGQTVRFLIDTGASDVVLSAQTARRIGIDVDRLSFDRVAMTANGPVRSAIVRLDTLRIGSVVRDQVAASVTQGPLEVNLLGMSFLRSLSGWRVEGNVLILRV